MCDVSLIFTFNPLQNFKCQALAVTCDPEHKFELALQLGEMKIAYDLAVEAEVSDLCHVRSYHATCLSLLEACGN